MTTVFDLPGLTKHMATTVWHLQRRTSNRTDRHEFENALNELISLETDIDMVRADLVYQARLEGFSWAQIAAMLGVSKSAAHQKYGKDC